MIEISVFPFTVFGPSRLQALFLKHNKGRWYQFDATVTSHDCVTFHVYDMLDNVYGGRGKHIRDFKVEHVWDELHGVISFEIKNLASKEYSRRERVKEQKEIELIAAVIEKQAERGSTTMFADDVEDRAP